MGSFVQRHAADVTGCLSGLDRLVLRGSLRQLSRADGVGAYLSVNGILLKDFGAHALGLTSRLKESHKAWVDGQGRPLEYLSSSSISKEARALEIAKADGVTEGLVCAFTVVEPCTSFDINRDRAAKKLKLVVRRRKGLFIYQYLIHPVFGWMNARIQTWLPFTTQICLNGREWLGRDLSAAGIAYERSDNCFPWIADVDAAQKLMDEQLTTDWPKLLDPIARQLHQNHDEVFKSFRQEYYWTVHQSEVACDVMFKNADRLDSLYPAAVLHAITTFGSPDVLRFLGHDGRVRSDGRTRAKCSAEVTSSYKSRPEGVRIKHSVNGNSVKAYNKAGTVLRVETTINNPRDFKVFRPDPANPNGPSKWQRLRQSTADLHRRVQVSDAANERYLAALAAVDDSPTVKDVLAPLVQRVAYAGGAARALRPWAPDDALLLTAVARGEFAINGFRNRDLRALLCSADGKSERQQAAAITRKIRLLRAHKLIRKVPKTQRYVITSEGHRVIPTILAARNASAKALSKVA